MLEMIKTTNNEMFKEFVLLEFNKKCNSLFLMNIQETFVNPMKVLLEFNKTTIFYYPASNYNNELFHLQLQYYIF